MRSERPFFWRGVDLTVHICGDKPCSPCVLYKVPVCMNAYSKAAVSRLPPLTPTQIAKIRTLFGR